MTIIASIPQFTATRTGEYVFDVSADKEIPEDSKLILLNGSKDLNGVFVSDVKNLKVSADFEAGKTYAPVIIAESKDEEIPSSGAGCNFSFGFMTLAAVLAIFKKK